MIWRILGFGFFMALIIALMLSFSGVTYVDFNNNLMVFFRLVTTKMSQKFVFQIPEIPTGADGNIYAIATLSTPFLGVLLAVFTQFINAIRAFINGIIWLLNVVLYVAQWVGTMFECISIYVDMVSSSEIVATFVV